MTSACDLGKLRRVLREEFVKMYESGDVAAMLESVGAPVERSALDIRLVLESDYFFA